MGETQRISPEELLSGTGQSPDDFVLPGQLFNLLGTSFGPGAAFTARLYGTTLFGNLFLTWLARNAEDCAARRGIIWDLSMMLLDSSSQLLYCFQAV